MRPLSLLSDQAVRQHRASVGDIEIVSNSLGALRRVLAARGGKAPRLADEPDFRYMMARDGRNEGGGLAFLGDRFVASVVGPRQKILEARRQLALAELSAPAYSALLYGWLEGQSPASLGALFSSGLLKKSDLRHADGKGAARLAFDVRVLPLIDGTDYSQLDELVGRTRVSVPALDSGLRATIGIGAHAEIRRHMREMASTGFMGQRFELDWLGDWGVFGVEDQTPLFEAMLANFKFFKVERPSRDEDDVRRARFMRNVPPLPIYAAIGIRQTEGAVLFLAGINLLFAVSRFRGEVAFDEEPRLGSGAPLMGLHAKATLDLQD